MKELVLCENCYGNGSIIDELEKGGLIYIICPICDGDCYVEKEVDDD